MNSPPAKSVAWWLATILLVSLPAQALDPPEVGDGSYGRLLQPWSSRVRAAFVFPSPQAVTGSFDLHYLHTAGFFVGATGPDGSCHPGNEPSSCGQVGVSLRPLFLYRFLQDHEQGPPRFDLAIDSLELRLGASFPMGKALDRPAVMGSIGLGVPWLQQFEGPWFQLEVMTVCPQKAMSRGSLRMCSLVGTAGISYSFYP